MVYQIVAVSPFSRHLWTTTLADMPCICWHLFDGTFLFVDRCCVSDLVSLKPSNPYRITYRNRLIEVSKARSTSQLSDRILQPCKWSLYFVHITPTRRKLNVSAIFLTEIAWVSLLVDVLSDMILRPLTWQWCVVFLVLHSTNVLARSRIWRWKSSLCEL